MALFEKQIDLTEPDAVVLQYYINDAEPNPQGQDNPFLMHSVVAAFGALRMRSLFMVGDKSLGDYYAELYDDSSPNWRRTKKAISNLKKLCDQRGIPLVVLIVPELHDMSKSGPYPALYKIVTDYLDTLGINSVNPTNDVRDIFVENPSDAWVARDDPHPNAKVHQIMGEALSQFFEDELNLFEPPAKDHLSQSPSN